jgi:hypothetical protein
MTKGRFILWSQRNYRTYYQFLTETRYEFILCVWNDVQERSFSHADGLFICFFPPLIVGWTNRQGRVCILLEQLDKKGKRALKKCNRFRFYILR